MSNVAAVLKAEITRVARKEVRTESQELRKLLGQQKTQIADLRKEVALLTKGLKQMAKASAGGRKDGDSAAALDDADGGGVQRRFSPARLLAHRQKLGLSVANYAALVGVSSPTLRGWELGKSRPDPQQLELIVAARSAKPEALAAPGGSPHPA